MADNYLQFSFLVGGDKHPLPESSINAFLQRMPWHPACWDCKKRSSDEDEPYDNEVCAACSVYGTAEFGLSFAAETDGPGRLWINSGDESGDVAAAADAVQWLLRLAESDEVVTIHYACTCSKLRVDEFTGGAVVVSRDGIVWFCQLDASSYASKQQKRIEKKGEAEPTELTVYDQFCTEEPHTREGEAQRELIRVLHKEGLLVELTPDYVRPTDKEDSQ